MRPFLFTLTFGALTTLALGAHADDDLPVVIAYVAPSECASTEAFHALVSAQVARTPNPDRPWRFSVTIQHDGDYVGTLKTETGSRELRAPTCDDVTAALSLVIAMAQPDLPAPKSPPPSAPQTLPPPPPRPPPLPVAFVRFTPPNDVAERRQNKSNVDWQFGVTVSNWQDGSELSATGAMGTVSAELPWGFPKMLFEVGAGALFSRGLAMTAPLGVMPVAQGVQPWLVVDAEACPLDLPLGSKTGLSVLGCARMVVGAVNGIAGWGGGGGRLRWQSPWHVFVESHFNGMYGTRLDGIPALMDFGGSVGFRL